MKSYDPIEYIKGLQQLLVSDKKRIGFLFGAGTSLAKKNESSISIPAIDEMTRKVIDKLSEKEIFKSAIVEIKSEIKEKEFNIETFLTNIESKKNVIGNGSLNNLDGNEFDDLIERTKKEIVNIVSIHKDILADGGIENLIHVDFAEWIGRANRKYPIEIFTTNYDYLFELGLEEKGIPYYDGFTGSFNPFFNANSIEKMDFLPNQTKLWKIHGSLGWKINGNRVQRKNSNYEDILIYPSVLKYDNSRKLPYISLMDRLSNYLKQSDTILIVSGYSFGDEHINERIITALNSQPSTHIFVLFYDKAWINNEETYTLDEHSKIARLAIENSKITVLGCRNAIIGSVFGEWKIKNKVDREDVDLFFNLEEYSDEWTGKGELILPDFSKFVKFLQGMIIDNGRRVN